MWYTYIAAQTVNNAGFVLGVERVGDIADADIDAMFNTNVLGLISMTQLVIKGSLQCFAQDEHV
jgi:NADP-dependent 3-hydroxy acid dehydrogenase YdfG